MSTSGSNRINEEAYRVIINEGPAAFNRWRLGYLGVNLKLDFKDFRGKKLPIPGKSEYAVRDLSGINFDCDINGGVVELAQANFAGCVLRGARFDHADLEEANFAGADCMDAIFRNARAYGACFDKANCFDAHFDGAMLRNARFVGARIEQATFTNADIDIPRVLEAIDAQLARGLRI